jgi:hypothetical protein
MTSAQTGDIAERAKTIYRERLQSVLEPEHAGEFVAIEPTSGRHFLSGSYSDAVASARTAYPDRLAFVIRVGHEVAVHLGGLTQ